MKSILTFCVLAAIFCAIVFAGCKKKKNESAATMLAGKWQMISQGYDANKNSVMDGDETKAFPDSVSCYAIFEGNGTGMTLTTYKGITDTSAFNWLLKSNDKYLMATLHGREMFIHDSNLIDQLSSTDLRLTINTFSSGLNWSNFKKQ